MKAFVSLAVSTLCVWSLVLFLALFVPTITGAHDPAAKATYFLQWIPGIGIAFLSGTTGAFFNGLLEIWNSRPSPTQNGGTQTPLSTVHFVIRPLLGAFAGFILFLFFAVGGLSLT